MNAPDAAILAAVEIWIDDLSRQDYDAAFARTEHDSYYRWSPPLIRRVIEGYGLQEPHPNGEVYRVSPRADAPGLPYTRTVERMDLPPGHLAEVRYGLPLNGEWSDLTATFGVQLRPEHSVLVLWEIHVF
ncbi:MAG: hypothetical protein HOW73_22575 [Polyangiaceae bacterium]|nr:hypothetical protein [Polyangiaceae bacterium]